MQLVTSASYPILPYQEAGLTPDGFSAEADLLRTVREQCSRQLARVERMLTEIRSRVQDGILAQIDGVTADCAADGWSGDQYSVAISRGSADNAKKFVSMLDVIQFPMVDVIPEPDGDLALEWHRDESRWLIASFEPDGHVNFACRTGVGSKTTGTSHLTDRFARIIQGYLAIVYSE